MISIARRVFALGALGAAATVVIAAGGLSKSKASTATGSAHDFEMMSIEGQPLPLSSFAGKPVLLVNTASMCGFTHQYNGLQALYDRYRDQGFVVLGVPSQDFNQEYASEEKVKEFCEVNFGLDFPMTEIVSVKGKNAHPLYQWLGAQGATPRWNFNKALIGGDGSLIAHYSSSTPPNSPRLIRDVEAALR